MKWFLAFISSLLPASLWAAACCGGGSGGAQVISGDFRYQVTMGMSYSSVIGEKYGEQSAYFWPEGRHQRTQLTRLSGLYAFDNGWQLGAGGEYLVRDYALTTGGKSEEAGVGDSDLIATYEFMPELSYSAWKPRGFLSLTQRIPTGKSVEESKDPYFADVTGDGQFASTLTLTLIKVRGEFDFMGQVGVTHRFARTIHQNNSKLGEGQSSQFFLDVGMSPGQGQWHLGFGVGGVLKDGRETTKGGRVLRSSSELVWDVSPSISYAFDEASASLRYSDQTLLGPVKNTTLSRTLLLQYQWRAAL
jgi:hypothetical protein